MADFIDRVADEASDDDESIDEETGEIRQRQRKINGSNGNLSDSSEESEDDAEEEARIREGFIVDDDEAEDDRKRRRRERKKRRREEQEQDNEELDEEDLDLIGELDRGPRQESKFKRLKRGPREERDSRGVADIFSDDVDEVVDDVDPLGRRRELAGEFDDFIEEDEFPEEENEKEELEVSRGPARNYINNLESSGLDEAGMEDMRAAFGDGTEYDWALELQEAMEDDQIDPDKPLELKDVFEPSQLKERMLTDEDNEIRARDIPERMQLSWKPFAHLEFSEDDMKSRIEEESAWIAQMLWPKKRFEDVTDRETLVEPFRQAIATVLRFTNIDHYDVPFIFQHRKDYLIHAERNTNGHQNGQEVLAEKLLEQNDLWEIMELDLRFKALSEKRESLKRSYRELQDMQPSTMDQVLEDMLGAAITMEEVQDMMEYFHFQYSAEIKDLNLRKETNGEKKRSRTGHAQYERLRAGKPYRVVKAFGVDPDTFANNALEGTVFGRTEDPDKMPDDLADDCVDEMLPTGSQVLIAAKRMLSEELINSPRMRKLMRKTYFTQSRLDCRRTEKGLKKIDEDHPYYEFKYLRNQTLRDVVENPDLFLRMLKAEEDGLVHLVLRIENDRSFRQNLYKTLESDNLSEIADAWNQARHEVLDMALSKLQPMMVQSVKENLKTECENLVAKRCRAAYLAKLDQAPYKPKGMVLGTVPRVLAIGTGPSGNPRDGISYAWVEDDGRCLEQGEWRDLRLGNEEKGLPDGVDVVRFKEICRRRNPDVVVVSGFTVEARKAYKDLQAIIERHGIMGNPYKDEDDLDRTDPLDVMMINDEVARLYHTSNRSDQELPGMKPTMKYTVALARYAMDPMKQYAALGKDIVSIFFHASQTLIPEEKLLKYLETAMMDIVNLVGVDINEAMVDPYTANLLPYICGLGPRKASALLQAVNRNGGIVGTRAELVGDPEAGKLQAVSPKIFENCASFLNIPWDEKVAEATADPLDNTRIHPEDYELARKMVADALELDEEDVAAEQEDGGSSAVIKKMLREDRQDAINELLLEQYADQLEMNFMQRKRATLETIRAELLGPYDELRRTFALLSSDQVFVMLTGETRDTLFEGMVVPVQIRRIFSDHIETRLDCGIEGTVQSIDFPSGIGPDGVEARSAFQIHQTIQAKILTLLRKQLSATLSLREEVVRRPARREIERTPGEWDINEEDADRREVLKQTERSTGRAQRVIKHPLFKPFNSRQAEEYLGPQTRGDVVIRPSGKGLDHLAVTWKVADNVFQHIDVLELDKENEFSVGRILKIGGKYTYSDLDELIVNHVKAMAKKVDELTLDERYQNGSKEQTDQWLNAYMEANPKRSMYAFCINRAYPGYFFLCFKNGQKRGGAWPIKVIPNAFELQKNAYPNMQALKNGFKTIMVNMASKGPPGARPYGR